MKQNTKLNKAKSVKNDEFYTLYEDIEKELNFYKEQLKGKIIYSNCDSEKSNFVKYFQNNFEKLGIKEFIFSSSDFRSPENLENLKRADIIITNPPFSKFKEFFNLLIESKKQFLIIGNFLAISYNLVFNCLQEKKVRLGVSPRKIDFLQPNGEIKSINACWFTNLNNKGLRKKVIFTEKFEENKYPKFDNYDAISCDKSKKIPVDYNGLIGVPTTFLEIWDEDEIELVDVLKKVKLNGKPKFTRVIIRWKK